MLLPIVFFEYRNVGVAGQTETVSIVVGNPKNRFINTTTPLWSIHAKLNLQLNNQNIKVKIKWSI